METCCWRTPRSCNYIADRYPEARLRAGFRRRTVEAAAVALVHRYRIAQGAVRAAVRQALADATKAKTLETGSKRLAYLSGHLQQHEYLLDTYSVADAYLTTVLNWNIATPVDLTAWPAVADYFQRLRSRPATARAMKEEFALYAEEQARHKRMEAKG